MEENRNEMNETVSEETEIVETVREEDGQTKEPKKGNNVWLFALIAIGVIALVLIQTFRNGGTAGGSGCDVIPQSPWGQSQAPVWVETKTPAETKAITNFTMEYPDAPEGYENRTFRAYTAQVFEVRYLNEKNEEGMRIDKAYICGKDVFEFIYSDTSEYTSIQKVKVGDYTVTMKGTSEYVYVASWLNGEYSYSIGVWGNPVTQEEMEALIMQVK